MMSTKDNGSPLEQPTNGKSLVVSGNSHEAVSDGEWTTTTVIPRSVASSPLDPTVYLHAVRRHWLLGTVLGVICCVAFGLTMWFLLPQNFTAESLIQVRMREDALLSGTRSPTAQQQEFEVYKNTQRELLRSQMVLTIALRKPGMSELEMVRREAPNEIVWLQDHLSVSFPGDAEIMQVSLTGRNPTEVTKLVRAVVDAYLSEIVESEQIERRSKLSQVRQLYSDKEEETRKKRSALKSLAERLKTTDKETMSIQHQVAMQRYGECRRELIRLQFSLADLKGELAAANAALKRIDESDVSQFELAEMIQRDARCQAYQRQIADLEPFVAQQQRALVPGTASTHVSQYTERLAGIQAEFDARRAELAEMIKAAKRSEIQEQVQDLTVRVQLQADEVKRQQELVSKEDAEVREIGRSFVDIDMARDELDSFEQTLGKLGEEKQALQVELRSQARVRLRQPAEEPTTYDNPRVNIAVSALAGVIGLVLPICGIVLWDVRKRRINSSEEVARSLGVPVIGSIPIVPGRAIRRLNSPNSKNQQWNVRLTESIDSIAAKLLRNAAIDKTRVVLITSAVSGEGKTTLATQVAMSLARAGRRTVLVDFDLRRPAIDKAFQLPLHPGVSEALCGENAILELVQPTGTKNLSVVTAGRCDRHALQALSSGVDARLFEELRAEYEFVVVDGSPILPVADSRYVSQHVDAVVLSIFRDYSRAPKVTAACEILETFGVHDLEAVVTSTSESGYGVIER